MRSRHTCPVRKVAPHRMNKSIDVCLRFTLITSALQLCTGCATRGLDLSRVEAQRLVHDACGYPREVFMTIPERGTGDPRSSVVISTNSRGPDGFLYNGQQKALIDHSIQERWFRVMEPLESWFEIVADSSSGSPWRYDAENSRFICRLGRADDIRVTGISGAIGGRDVDVEYDDTVRLAEDWRGVIGKNGLLEFVGFRVKAIRYDDGWRVQTR